MLYQTYLAPTVFITMYKKPRDAARANTALDFFSLDYGPLPEKLRDAKRKLLESQFVVVKD